ncbi:hypothetical protein [Paenibacillus silvisoli]|uniref:hypothetical protein n=1 Tax=Paenibacillus silvisoli TaxID=3110539 RepID=UPI002805AA2A|nr:hypothetical protein [Paenibacillus silvisoli]
MATILLLAAVSACSADRNGSMEVNDTKTSASDNSNSSIPNDDQQPADPTTTPDHSVNLPATKTDTIELEGMEESFQFTLHDSPALGFSTYIANDLVVEEISSEEGETMLVYANFAEQKNVEAKVQLFSKSAGTKMSIKELTELAEQILKSGGFEIEQRMEPSPKRFEWSENEFDFAGKSEGGETVLGTVSVFQHAERVYYAIVQYPAVYEEGFVPRVVKMFEDIVWY